VSNVNVDGPPAHVHDFNTANPAGGEVNGATHENMPPFLTINYIIRAG
jgi:microcystin-dependent protein